MGSPSQSDMGRLLLEARQGSTKSLGTLLELHRQYLQALARARIDARLRARASPSDLVQETFVRACRHFDQFRGTTEQEWLTWLRRIFVHSLGRLVEEQVIAQKRSVQRDVPLRQDSQSSSAPAREPALISPGSSPSAQAQRHELANTVAAQLARLPEDYRQVLVLRNIEGQPFAEVARRMGRTSGAVRVLWLRALAHLREQQVEESA